MKIKIEDLHTIALAVTELSRISVSASLGWDIVDMLDNIEDKVKNYENIKNGTIEKYCKKDENGKGIYTKVMTQYGERNKPVIDNDNDSQQLDLELFELNTKEIEISLTKLNKIDLDKLIITSENRRVLKKFDLLY